MHSQVVIVGGGAGGLELACKLGRKLGAGKVMLVDSALYHIWKPSLHEVAAGTLDIHQEGLSYQMLAHDNGFSFVYGALTALQADRNELCVGAVYEGTELLLPPRRIAYQTLVLALGSTANYFGVPGAAEHTIALNTTEDAERFRMRLLRLLTLASVRPPGAGPGGVDIVIIGGGATGVELAAELREASAAYTAYDFPNLEPRRDVRLTLLESGPRILAPLPEKLSAAALRLLREQGVQVAAATRVSAITAERVMTADGAAYPADLVVWAAGIKAPALLATLGLPVTRSGQLQVSEQLQVAGSGNIFALGDCAACPDCAGKLVPPRAQAAHQQASYLLQTLCRLDAGQPPQRQPYRYRDYGSLVSFGHRSTVGSLMGSLKGLSWFVDGRVARLMYVSLHLMHHRAVLGALRTALLAAARYLIRRSKPRVKLH